MGLFDDLLRNALGSEARDPAGQSQSLLEGLVSMLQEPQVGGVEGLARIFQQRGLGQEADSWIGTGQNRPITPEQLTQALGSQRVESLASQLGLGKIAGAAAIAALLPVLIDKLTPDGRAPQTASLGGLLGSLLGGGAARPQPAPPPARAPAPPPAWPRAELPSAPPAAPAAPARPPDQWYTVVPGDSLSKIAQRFYGDASQWPRIFDANRDQLQNPDRIRQGQKLKIPTVQKSV
jgi:uncharacterized protein YidB (DUF937 family)